MSLMSCRFRYRNSKTLIEEGCDDDCYKEIFCTMVTTYVEDEDRCRITEEILDSNSP